MLSTLVCARAARLLAASVALAGLAACNDDDPAGPDDHAEEVEAIRLTVTQNATTNTFTYEPGQKPTLHLPVGASTVTATFLAADGDVIDDLEPDEHTLQIDQITPAAAFTFGRTGPFAGTINAPAAGAATARVCLTHGDHCDLEFLAVPVTIGN